MYQVVNGEDRVLTIYCRNSDSTPVDLTGATINVELPKANGTTVNKTGTITDAADGIFTITIADTDALLVAQNIPIDIEVTISGNIRIYPSADGLAVLPKTY